jgi:hypothetical protein
MKTKEEKLVSTVQKIINDAILLGETRQDTPKNKFELDQRIYILLKQQREEIKNVLYGLNWIKILNDAIKSRPLSWNDNPVREWRNASDEICFEVIRSL